MNHLCIKRSMHELEKTGCYQNLSIYRTLRQILISEALVGIKITDRFLKLLQQVDKTEDRPWAMLREKFYFNQTFTEEMSRKLTSNWDEIGGK